MDIEQLYRDYGISTVDSGKHFREGWVNCACPFCHGNAGHHLGWNIREEYFVCWRCGGKPLKSTFAAILRVPISEVSNILAKYKYTPKKVSKVVKIALKPFKLPSGISDTLLDSHRKYLEKRKYDPDEIQRIWNISSAGVYSLLDGINYKHRIIIPFYWNNEIVTFQGRDVTDRHPQKYLACPAERERMNIKTILYGNQSKWGDLGIGVEGVTDVWRFGESSCGLSGIKYKPQQVRLIAKTFKRFIVVFDDEPQAQKQAESLAAELCFRGVDSFSISVPGDPGSMKQKDADALVRQLKTWKIK